MSYVMVPVPQEYVLDVMRYVVREVFRVGLQPWNAESVAELLADADDQPRSLISLVARRWRGNDPPSVEEASRALGMTPGELLLAARTLRDRALAMELPEPLSLDQGYRDGGGELPFRRSVYYMPDDLAELIVAAESA